MKFISSAKIILYFILLFQPLYLVLSQMHDSNSYVISDNLLRINFINSNLSPLLIVPGLLGTSLKVKINCKNYIISLKYTDDFNIFSKYYISRGICKDQNKEEMETYKLWIDTSINGNLSVIKFSKNNTNNECFAFLMLYSNYSDNPKLLKTVYSKYLDKDNLENVKINFTNRNPHIYVGPYFGKKDIKCGFSAINNLSATKNLFDTSKGYRDIYNELLKKGY